MDAQPPQHIIIIEVDQWAGFLLGAISARKSPVETPYLDALAKHGVLYSTAVCNSPISLPSRLSMLTGRLPSSTGQFGFAGLSRKDVPWMPGLFKAAGFTTAAIGKFHCRSIGFDRWNFDISEPTLLEERDFSKPSGSNYETYCVNLGYPYPHDQMHGHSPEKGQVPAFSPHASKDGHRMYQFSAKSAVPVEHSVETWTTNRALEFFKNHSAKPTFSWISYHRPHFPTTLPEPFWTKALERKINFAPLPTPEELERMAPAELWQHLNDCSRLNLGDEKFGHVLATYFTLIEWIDQEIGRLLAGLEELGIRDRATIIFTADHGDEAGQKGLYNKHLGVGSLPVVHVPLIICPAPALFPNAKRGRMKAAPVSLVDIFPTLCALSGISAPSGLDGISLMDSSARPVKISNDRIVLTEDIYFCNGKRRYGASVLGGGLRYVFDSSESARRLYHLSGAEETVVSEEDHIDAVIRMKKALLAHLSRQLFGAYSESDVQLVEKEIDPSSELLAPHFAGPQKTVFFRAFAICRDGDFTLYIPFYDRACLLFKKDIPSGRNDYWKADMAIAPDRKIINRMLTIALEETAAFIPSASILRIVNED